MSAGRRDVVVVGGGPAGATAAALIAREGHGVLLLDRDEFPRYRVGESLMPASYWTLQRLGVLDKLSGGVYPRKHSVQFFSEDGRASKPFYFSEVDRHESSVTWQVDRLSFDRMLLDNARSSGVEVRERVNVKDVLFDHSRATGVLAEYGTREEIPARVVVDATGQTALIARKLKLKNPDPELRHASFFTRYRGAVRDEGIDEGATLIMRTTADRSWFWYIPLPDDLASVGVVGPVDHLLKGRGSDPGTVFREEIERCPALETRVRNAEQVARVRVMRDFSYISHRIAGDGYAYYDESFSIGDFLKRNPQFRGQVVNLLIGNVFRMPVDGLFEAMGRECALPAPRKLTAAEEPS